MGSRLMPARYSDPWYIGLGGRRRLGRAAALDVTGDRFAEALRDCDPRGWRADRYTAVLPQRVDSRL